MALNLKDYTSELMFIPLGGSNEIGMNLNLYGYQDQWIMVDLGIGFANDYLPGVEVIVPDIQFLKQIKGKLLGIVLTHAHEDHFGAVPYLWEEVGVPIYATPFTSALLKLKLAEEGMRGRVDIRDVKTGGSLQLGPFGIEMIELTHSIPEMQALAITTDKGVVVHTGDWKFDADPVVGPASNEKRLAELGEKGVLAVVCDSTNVFVEGESGSEGGVRERLVEAVKNVKTGRVVVTTFASNVARVESVIYAAQEAGRAVVLAGRSLWRVTEAAKEAGYLKDAKPFLTEKDAMDVPKDKVLILCTGCQGEARAALAKMARGEHHSLRLSPGDTVIFSSRKIPGNEMKIGYMQNKLVEAGVEVLTDSQLDVHVSGHPARDELIKMYQFLKPKIAIPVHGEPRHIREHTRLAKSQGVQHTIEVRNGHALTIGQDVRFVGTVPSGYVAIDGISLIPTDSPVLRMRRKLRDDGSVFVALALDEDWRLAADPKITAPGSLDPETDADVLDALVEAIGETVDNMKRNVNTQAIQDAVRQTVRRLCNNELGKKPVVEVLVVRV